jgi:hypothetical protein
MFRREISRWTWGIGKQNRPQLYPTAAFGLPRKMIDDMKNILLGLRRLITQHDSPPQPPATKREFTITVECEVNERHAQFDAAWALTKWRLINAIQDALERPRGHGSEMPAKKGSTCVNFE